MRLRLVEFEASGQHLVRERSRKLPAILADWSSVGTHDVSAFPHNPCGLPHPYASDQ